MYVKQNTYAHQTEEQALGSVSVGCVHLCGQEQGYSGRADDGLEKGSWARELQRQSEAVASRSAAPCLLFSFLVACSPMCICVCVLLAHPSAHTLSQLLFHCCADHDRASLWAGLVPGQHGGKRGSRQVGTGLSVHIRFTPRRQRAWARS